MQRKRIQVFEHDKLIIGQTDDNNVKFEESHYKALFKLNEVHNDKYFRPLHNGICFKQYVGVIQVEGLTIEVLPKIDRSSGNKSDWQSVLIDMLRIVKKMKVRHTENANVEKQSRHLLDIYFEWYLSEVNALIHRGLIKQYYRETGNVKALKGKLEFACHISKNLVHKERFYTTHQVYGTDHIIHQILAKALTIISRFSKGTYVYSLCKTVQASFPEVSDIMVTAETFTKLKENRKTAPYHTALEIAKFIILQYAPNVKSGNENMLALLFDMNMLWEQYILSKLQVATQGKDILVHDQREKAFWNRIAIRPDIVIEKNDSYKNSKHFIIDTKWKNISGSKPSTDDLRQMYVYNDYWSSTDAMLLYPGVNSNFNGFTPFNTFGNITEHHRCGIAELSIFLEGTNRLDENIGEKLLAWFEDYQFVRTV